MRNLLAFGTLGIFLWPYVHGIQRFSDSEQLVLAREHEHERGQ